MVMKYSESTGKLVRQRSYGHQYQMGHSHEDEENNQGGFFGNWSFWINKSFGRKSQILKLSLK